MNPMNPVDYTPYTIFTYQRCGSHLLDSLLLENAGLLTRRTHKPEELHNSKVILSIARDPAEAISSHLATYVDQRSNVKNNINNHAKFFVERFIALTEEIMSKANFVVKYDDLVNDPRNTLNLLCKKLGITVVADNMSVEVVDNPRSGYIKSSKVLDSYELAVAAVSECDLSEAYGVYKRFEAMSI
jgi:hypothetical protein